MGPLLCHLQYNKVKHLQAADGNPIVNPENPNSLEPSAKFSIILMFEILQCLVLGYTVQVIYSLVSKTKFKYSVDIRIVSRYCEVQISEPV